MLRKYVCQKGGVGGKGNNRSDEVPTDQDQAVEEATNVAEPIEQAICSALVDQPLLR